MRGHPRLQRVPMLAVQAGCAPLSTSSVKSSKARVRCLPVVTYDDHETDYRGDHRSDEPPLDFFFFNIYVIFRRIRQTILFSVCWSTRAPSGWGVFCPRVSLSCFISSLLVASTKLCPFVLVSSASLELRSLRSYVYAVVWLHICPGPYFEVELV